MTNVYCPICKKKNLNRLRSHIYRAHPDFDVSKLLEIYPGIKTVSDEYSSKVKEQRQKEFERDPEYFKEVCRSGGRAACKVIHSSPETHNTVMKKLHHGRDKFNHSEEGKRFHKELGRRCMKQNWNNPEFVEKAKIRSSELFTYLNNHDEEFMKRRDERASKRFKMLNSDETWKRNHVEWMRNNVWNTEEFIESVKAGVRRKIESDPEFCKRRNRKVNESRVQHRLSDPEWAARLDEINRQVMLELHKSGEFLEKKHKSSGRKRYKFEYSDKVIMMRSTWELKLGEFLVGNNLDFEYEPFRVPRLDKSYYLPDFYLPKYNLILEVHPSVLIDQNMIIKKESSIKEGYNFLFITEHELWSDDLLELIQCVTT